MINLIPPCASSPSTNNIKEMHETVISKNQLATSCHPYLYTPRCILYKTFDAVYVEFSIMLVSTLFTAINAVKINKHSEVALLELLLLYDPSCSFVGRSVGRSEFPKRAGTCSSILLSEHLFTFVKIKQSKRAGT